MLLSSAALYRFKPDGRLAWSLKSLAGADQGALPASAPIAVDWSRGLIYICDLGGRRITKILDTAWCREKGIRNELEEKVIALRGSNAEIARLYQSAGSTFMARAYWQKVEDADPGNAEADTRLLAIEVDDLRTAAHDLDAKARSTLSTIGIETARPGSVLAIQKYELLLSKAPDDEKSRAAMNGRAPPFHGHDAGTRKEKASFHHRLSPCKPFPLTHALVRSARAGNREGDEHPRRPVVKVSASLFIPGFMDLPYESAPIAKLASGESVTFDLSPVFSQKVLDLQEDMAVQAQVTVTWSAGGVEQTASHAGPATIYRNTALTWDDTRKISSYITPNEGTVSGFAARAVSGAAGGAGAAAGGAPQAGAVGAAAVGGGSSAASTPRPRFSRTMMQAIRICDALGAYGITYTQNLDSPFSKALGKAEIIDTVHFPRITLYNRTGDCSDTTALLCSLLEAVGIRTAAITTPGHIFAAFDSDEPAENAPFLRGNGLEVITRNGKSWIPVETTILSQGFMAAWGSASGLVQKYSSTGPFEFIPVAEMRDTYPALSLPPGSLTVAEPAAARVDAAFSATLTKYRGPLHRAACRHGVRACHALSGRQAVKTRVQEGVLHAFFGRLPEAESAFRKAIGEDPTLVSPYVNLANVRLLSGDEDGALLAVKQGLARNADSALLNLLAARIYSDKGDTSNTSVFFAKVQKSAPDLAARFADLAPAGGGKSQRAAQYGQAPVVIWGADQ